MLTLALNCVAFGSVIALVSASALAATPLPQPTDSPILVYVNWSKVPLQGPNVIIPEDTAQIRIHIAAPPGQVRYRLEGIDEWWKQRAGTMEFGLRFMNQDQDVIETDLFPASGRSQGWKDSLETSTLTSRQETVTVPPGATHVEITMSSAGPPASVGIFAVSDVSLIRQKTDKSGEETLISSEPFLSKAGLVPVEQAWKKEGTHPTMAKLTTLGGPNGLFRAFTIVDDDIRGHADWTSPDQGNARLIPGETLTLRWKEAYTNGQGDPFTEAYGALPPGNYRFRVEEVGMNGLPLTQEYSIMLIVPLPYWRNPWLWAMCLAGLLIVGIAIGRYVVNANIRRHLNRVRVIEEERLRISRDLHDALGTRLSQICLASSHAKQSASGQTLENIRSINVMAQEVMTTLAETIWMLNPKNDNLESLVDMLCRLVPALCKTSGIRCRVEAELITVDLAVSNDFRHHISLTIREAVTNAIRHSGATEIRFSVKFESDILKMSLSDDGKGIQMPSPDKITRGNGLAN